MAETFDPPQRVQSAARRGLRLHDKTKSATAVGIARGRDLSNGRAVSLDTIGRMVSFFARHGAQRPSNIGTDSEPTPWLVAWLLWGGDAGRSWAESVWRRRGPDAASDDYELRGGTIAPIAEFRADGDAPDDMTPGRPLRVISTGRLFSRVTGEEVRSLTRDDLTSMADYINARAESDPVPWRLGHAWAEDRAKSADEVLPLGLAREAAVEDDGDLSYLTVRSHWTPYGVDVLSRGRGALWPSMEWVHRPAHDRDTGEQVGALLPIGIAVTPQPQYPAHRLSAVVLNSETIPPAEGITTGAEPQGDDMSEELMALMERLDALEARLGALESAPESDAPDEGGEVEAAGFMPDEMRSEVVAVRDALKGAVQAEQAKHDADAKALAELRSEVDDLKAAKQAAEFRSEWADMLVSGKVEPHEQKMFMEARSEQAAGRGAFFAAMFGDRAEGQFRSERAAVSEVKDTGKAADPLAGARSFFEARGEKFARTNPNYAGLLVAYRKEAAK